MKREASDLLIRKVDASLKDVLRKRAGTRDRSLSEKAKAALRRGLAGQACD